MMCGTVCTFVKIRNTVLKWSCVFNVIFLKLFVVNHRLSIDYRSMNFGWQLHVNEQFLPLHLKLN
jgi:hypothetical protein